MKAIVIPGMNDMNKGDQALIWESVRLVEDTGLFESVKAMANGDTPEEMEQLCSQSCSRGIKLVYNILHHPRRGEHQNDFRESYLNSFRLVKNAVKDYLTLNFLCNNLNRPALLSLLYDQNVLHAVREFKEADVIFVKGGGFVHAYGELTAPYLMWYFLFYVRLANKLGKKVVILPNSFGPFKGMTVKSQITKAIKNADLIYAREQQSAQELSSLLNREIPVAKDLGFFLQKKCDKKRLDFLPSDFVEGKKKMVGFTVRPWRFPGRINGEKLYQEYLDSVVALINFLTAKNYGVVFFNQSLGPNTHEDDRVAISEVVERIGKSNSVYWVDQDFTCEELQSFYGELDFMVGTRFHSVIFALNSGVPSLAIGYGGNKASGIMGDFNFDEYTIPIDDLTAELLISTFEKIENNQDQIREKLQQIQGNIKTARERLIGEIRNKILQKNGDHFNWRNFPI